MSQSVIGSLRVNLGLDSAQFEKGAKRSQNTLATMRKRFLVVSAAAAAMGAALSAAALKGAQDIDRAAKAARRIDSSIGGFRALELAAGEAGVSVSTLADAVQTMDREIAKGSKSAGEALERLGLNAKSLEGLDADQKIAKIADAIQDMGLTTADASVVLQQLGVRNREMVLAIMGGGGALRDARRDIESYGLAISKIDSDRIEKANDQIGRLGLISQYAGQQLAIALVPAMGRLAQVMTDSLREGGLLRGMIDGLVNNLDLLAFSVAAVTAVIGGRFVAALVVSTAAIVKKTLAAGVAATAMRALGVAMAFAGGPLGAIIAILGAGAAAYLVWGRDAGVAATAADEGKVAVNLLNEALDNFSQSAAPDAQSAALTTAQAHKQQALAAIEAAKAQLELNRAMLQESLEGVSSGRRRTQRNLRGTISVQEQELASLAASLEMATDRANALGVSLETVAAPAAQRTERTVSELGDAAGGAGKAMQDAKDDAADMAGALDGPVTSAIDGMAQAFGDFVARGFKDFKSFTKGIIDSFKRMIAQMIATAVANPIRIALGVGGSVAGTAANAAGGMLGGAGGIAGTIASLGTFASSIGTGLAGVMGGGGIAAGVSGGLAAGGAAGMGMALGAALPILAPLAIGAFLLNRRKKRRERRRAAEQQRQEAEQAEQQRLAQVAEVAFGMDNRILELQGKGVEALTRVRERELASIDASLRPRLEQIFALEDMNRIMDERFGIENRLLELQGRGAEVLARNRQKEVDATDAANRAILQQVFALEDQAEAAGAAAEAVRIGQAAIQRTMDLFRAPLSLDSDRFDNRFTATIQAAEDRRFQVQKEAESAQLTELKLMRLALEELRRETRDAGLYGVTA